MPKSLAAATVDRLLHHAHVVITDGAESYRLAQATAGKGVRAPGLTVRAAASPLRLALRAQLRDDGRAPNAMGRTDGHQRGENKAAGGENRRPYLARNEPGWVPRRPN
jgi:hypothetical protein